MRWMTSLGALTGIVAATTIAAAEVRIEPRLTTGLSYYNLDLDGPTVVEGSSVDDIEFNDFLYVLGGGATVTMDRFFLDLFGQYSFDGEDDLDIDVLVGGVAANDLAQSVEFDRVETSIALGYRITDNFAAYVGYRYADVDFDGSGSIGGIGVDFTTDFEQRGPLVGATYAIPTTILNGRLVANTAVAFLDGDLAIDVESAVAVNDFEADIDGDAIGVNAGLNWATPIAERLTLVVGGDVSHYSFDDDADQTDFEELIARLRAELRYSFDTGRLVGAR